MPVALQIIQLAQLLVPLGVKVITEWRRNDDGTTDVTITFQMNNEKFDADIKQAMDWFAAHPDQKPPVTNG